MQVIPAVVEVRRSLFEHIILSTLALYAYHIVLIYQDPSFLFDFPSPTDSLDPPIISLSGVCFGYTSDKELFRNIDLSIDCDSRLALVYWFLLPSLLYSYFRLEEMGKVNQHF
jgi:hypothetical protein